MQSNLSRITTFSLHFVQMYSEKFGYPINASQELIAIGSSNIISGVFQGHPVGGPLSRSALSISAGRLLFWNDNRRFANLKAWFINRVPWQAHGL